MEHAIVFSCRGERLVGVLSAGVTVGDLGVVIIVGGPQYRVGSHRQFVRLARSLAQSGVPTLRFDCRGMGDSTGDARSFDDSVPDIESAIDALVRECSRVRRVVLWGLCDAASAALLYWGATGDVRVAGLALANPWVRSAATHARAELRHYYAKRLVQREFWAKLARFQVDVLGAAQSVGRQVIVAQTNTPAGAGAFQDRMADSLRAFEAPVLLLLSGRDLTAQEFQDLAQSDPRWKGLLQRPNVTLCELQEADHTFSAERVSAEVESQTARWLLARVYPAKP
jgi:exosortase A-associated hydrolase 1